MRGSTANAYTQNQKHIGKQQDTYNMKEILDGVTRLQALLAEQREVIARINQLLNNNDYEQNNNHSVFGNWQGHVQSRDAGQDDPKRNPQGMSQVESGLSEMYY